MPSQYTVSVRPQAALFPLRMSQLAQHLELLKSVNEVFFEQVYSEEETPLNWVLLFK